MTHIYYSEGELFLFISCEFVFIIIPFKIINIFPFFIIYRRVILDVFREC